MTTATTPAGAEAKMDEERGGEEGATAAGAPRGSLLGRLLGPFRQGWRPAATATGVYVPLYVYPRGPGLGEFERVARSCRAHPAVRVVVTVNPSSGPGAAADPAYRSAVSLLQGAGALVLGYVYTSWGRRPLQDVAGEVEKYRAWYGVDGVLFDEFATDPGLEARLRAMCDHARSTGAGLVVANPGTDIPARFLGAADCYMIYENAGLPGDDWLGGWHAGHDKGNWSSCSYGVGHLDEGAVESMARRVGLMYVTDDGLPNPYDSLCSYFERLVELLDPGKRRHTG